MDRKKTTQIAELKLPLKIGLSFHVTRADKPVHKSAEVKI